MFNGVPSEQYHQFIASRTALPLPLPLTLPHLQVTPAPNTFTLGHHDQLFHQPHHLLQQLHRPGRRQSSIHDQDEEKDQQDEEVRSVSQEMDPWLKEEVVALLTIRSNLGDDFSDFIWGHVSRKLGELGYKRCAEKCKEKFEEVSRYCNSNNTNSYSSNYRSLGELEALFEDQNPAKSTMDHEKMVESNEGGGEKRGLINLEENSGNETLENPIVENQFEEKKPKKKKRKRYNKLELLKGFSEVVNKIMIQQEEMHKKLLDDIGRREEERIVREEAWRKKEMDRLNKEVEIRAQEQAIACGRDVTIIEFLKQFTSTPPSKNQVKNDGPNTPAENPNLPATPQNPKPHASLNLPTSSTIVHESQNPNHGTTSTSQKNLDQVHISLPQNPSSFPTNNVIGSTTTTTTTTTTSPILAPLNPNPTSNYGDDYGKRWPREEVYSLINLRCNLYNNGEDKESTKAPLWEKISQGMLELGYKRSAKKCKEKWENINKYFRKTKDANKKRPLDSKTCPYFHQLSNFYNSQASSSRPIIHQQSAEAPDNHSSSTENHHRSQTPEESHIGQSSSQGGAGTGTGTGGFSEAMVLEY
ncbi:hypothetical protein GIB67_033481 [Kingdonia uniflora]|uniref:Myb-like domain-containing protein n=1 Tax=Kingdonia uniflora TaxID=39325 RepID=A0A7J7L629_9MAGN|nr:hypothetical protein GIB67_033481 [Kingdonia uniflora]